MSRRHAEETSFGSDSFLDVVANIVGILIILIVVAGVRVTNAPLLSLEEKAEDSNSEAPVVSIFPNEPMEDEVPLVAELFTELQPESEEEVSVPDFVPPPDLEFPEIQQVQEPFGVVQRVRELSNDREELKVRLGELKQQLSSIDDSKDDELEKVQQLQSELEVVEQSLLEKQKLAELLEGTNLKTQQVIDVLAKRLEEVQDTKPEPEQLAHRLNPVGRVVSGKEVHFRLSGNKISFVPVEQLAEMVKRDMHRRRDFLMRQPRFQSTVGPVNGYEMEYLVQRESGSILEDIRFGSGMVRISVTDWVVRPTRDVESESFRDAIQPNSQFRSALISEGSNATVTFWVYPDSYELHRKLKQLVHESGFWVASRPLPTGYPIAGSSSAGSKSIAQ